MKTLCENEINTEESRARGREWKECAGQASPAFQLNEYISLLWLSLAIEEGLTNMEIVELHLTYAKYSFLACSFFF